MEITNNYSGYAANSLSDSKKATYTTTQATEENSKTHSSAREYRKYLSDKYECLKSKEYSVSINSALLSKAMGDKKTSDWLEYNLSIMPQAYEKMKSAVEARGSKILSCKTEITGYDSMETQMVTRAEVDTGVEKARKELKERIEERQKEKKDMEERAAKRQAEKEQEEERIAKAKTGEARISATGNSVESVTKSVISGISANVGAGVAGFDVKA